MAPLHTALTSPQELSRVHNTFHVSNLKRCYSDDPLTVPLDRLHVDDKLQFVEEPVEIMDREVASDHLRDALSVIFGLSVTQGGHLDPFVEIPSDEIKVHIEVLSLLWGNRLPIPDGSLPLSRYSQYSQMDKNEHEIGRAWENEAEDVPA
ncbi:hypothetical protein Tco_0797733 [Tanacetum coccineum]